MLLTFLAEKQAAIIWEVVYDSFDKVGLILLQYSICTIVEILQQYLLRVSSVKSAELGHKDRLRLLRNPMIYDLGLDFKYYQNKLSKTFFHFVKILDF